METRTLSKVSLAELTATFNEAFSDYMVPVQVTEEQMSRKIKTAKMDMKLSSGAFVNGRLVGFILHGVGKRNNKTVLWNGGTGVVPDQRGKKITEKLYQHLIPVLKSKGHEDVVLEVIVGNDPAIHVYKKIGFEIARDLDCFKGNVKTTKVLKNVDLRRIKKINDWKNFEALRSWNPTYQNANQRMNLLSDVIQVIEAYVKDELVGYVLFDKNPEMGDIYQFAVKEEFRQRGIARALFAMVNEEKKVPLKIINVDAGHAPSIAFFESLGFDRIVGQHEMKLKI